MGNYDINSRIVRASEKAKALGVDVVYIRNTFNLQWLTQFENAFDHEQCHLLLVFSDGSAVLHTDTRYINAFQDAQKANGLNIDLQCSGLTNIQFAAKTISDKGNELTIGLENTITLQEYRQIQQTFGEASGNKLQFLELDSFVPILRSVKDELEIEIMRKAQAITDDAFDHICGFIKPGLTETQLQKELEGYMFAQGASGLAFPTIIATGANAANPHAQPGENVVEQGHCVLFDFGAKYGQYCSDMTRCIFMGKPSADSKLAKAYDAVRFTNEKCEDAIKAGVPAKEIQELADKTLDEFGFGGKMGHSLGHGVGVEIHEEPYLKLQSNAILEEGNVVTIEPGVYFPGEFGIRLEDYGVVTKDGIDIFTSTTHDMIVV